MPERLEGVKLGVKAREGIVCSGIFLKFSTDLQNSRKILCDFLKVIFFPNTQQTIQMGKSKQKCGKSKVKLTEF